MHKLVFAVFCFGVISLSAEDVHRSVKNMGYSIHNLDQEVSQLKEKTQNQDSILDSMNKEVQALIKSAKEMQKQHQAKVDQRLNQLEENINKLVQDLKQFKKYADESLSSFTQIHTKISENEQLSNVLSQQIKELQSALRSLVKAVDGDIKEYRVQQGDTLDKIAKKHGTTVDAIKKHNNLKKDIIYPAQKLEIP